MHASLHHCQWILHGWQLLLPVLVPHQVRGFDDVRVPLLPVRSAAATATPDQQFRLHGPKRLGGQQRRHVSRLRVVCRRRLGRQRRSALHPARKKRRFGEEGVLRLWRRNRRYSASALYSAAHSHKRAVVCPRVLLLACTHGVDACTRNPLRRILDPCALCALACARQVHTNLLPWGTVRV